MQYGKLLAQLEASEMARRELGDRVRDLMDKCHRLKREKREAVKDLSVPLGMQRKMSVARQSKKKESHSRKLPPQVKVVVCSKQLEKKAMREIHAVEGLHYGTVAK